MKFVAILLLGLMMTGCAEKTQYGKCVGLGQEKNKELDYQYSVGNVALGIVFSETIIIPAVVLFTALECPVGPKGAKK